ncbi:MAG: hypothetical protein ACI4N3_05390 [Alphaproteobacteria bacterium]
MSFNLNEERKIYIKELKETYENPDKTDVDANRFLDFGRALIATNNDNLISNISKVSSILNKRKFDSFYIPYALFVNYKDTTFDLRDPSYETTFMPEEKEEKLKESVSLLKNKLNNKEIIEQIYKLIRSGDNIDIIYNPEKLKKVIKDIEKTQKLTSIVNEMSNEK